MLTETETPLGDHMSPEESSDNTNGILEGQVSEEVTDPSVDDGQSGGTESFYVYKDGDTEQSFKDAKELSDYIRSGTLRHADYTQKTQSLAEQRKAYEAEKARYDAEYTTFLQRRQEYDKIEKYLKSLPPEVYNKLKQGINSQPQQREFKDPRIDQLIKEREEEKQRQENEAMREKAFASLTSTYSDFNKESVMEAVNKFQELAPGDSMRKFLELVYLAEKGKTSPAQIEQKTAELLRRKSTIATPMNSTTSTPTKGIKQFSSLDDAAEAAYRELQ